MGYKYNPFTGEFDRVDISSQPSDVATEYDTNSGNAVPIASILDILGTNGITTSGATNIVTVTGVNATAAASSGLATKGVVSFDSANFSVSSGFVSLATGGMGVENVLTDDGAPTVEPDGSGTLNILGTNGIVTSGQGPGNTITISPSASGFPITPYVVGPIGEAGYQTIQAGINAANAAGGGVVYIMPGTYTEDLTLYDAVDLYGTPAVSQNGGSSTSIIGTHTPPTTGHIGFNSIYFQDTAAIFSSAAAGTTHIVLLNCESAVQNGYFFDLLNWTGILEVWDHNPSASGAPFAVEDGGINNTGGATLYMFGASFGFGTTNTMTLSGTVEMGEADILCPINFVTGSVIATDVVQFAETITFSNDTTGEFNTCRFTGGASAAITMSSSAAIAISTSIVQSSNNPAIAGAGAGTLTLSGIQFTDNAAIAGTLTLGTSSVYPVKMSNGQLLIGSTGQPAVAAAITSTGSSIAVTNGAGSINLEAAATIATSYATDSGTATPALNSLSVVGTGGIATSGSGSTLTIDGSAIPGSMSWVEVTGTSQNAAVNTGYIANNVALVTITLPASFAKGDIVQVAGLGTGLWSLVANTADIINFGSSPTSGGGSITATNRYDCIQIVGVVTDTTWVVLSSVGNMTVA